MLAGERGEAMNPNPSHARIFVAIVVILVIGLGLASLDGDMSDMPVAAIPLSAAAGLAILVTGNSDDD